MRNGVVEMKKILSVILTIALVFTVALPALTSDMPTQKEEVVYGLLGADGIIQNLYVVNSFDGGMVTDYGDYSEVHNMTSLEVLTQTDDMIAVITTADRFYYQGTLKTKALPWYVEIQYELDGKDILASDLAGKSGALEINIDITQNNAIDPVFYDHYMLQISLMIDTERCITIESPDATIANAGKNKIITHTVLPDNDRTILIVMQVRDFEMSGIEMNAMPFSIRMDMPDTNSIVNDLTRLADAVSELNGGMKKLSDGASDTLTGAAKLVNGSSIVADGLSALSDSSLRVLNSSAMIEAALKDMAKAIDNDAGDFSMDDIAALPEGLRQLASGLSDLSEGMQTLKTGYASAYSALDSAILAIPDSDIDPSGLYAAISSEDALTATLNQLMGYYQAGKTVKGTYAAVQGAFASVESYLDTMISSIGVMTETISEMANQIEQSTSGMDIVAQIEQLKDGLATLSNNYSQFHAGLDEYTAGVKRLAGSYSEVNTGIQSLSSGIGGLSSGASDLYKGTDELNRAVADLPDMIQIEIDGMAKQFDKSEFIPKSFVSAKNTNVKMVQFVIKTRPIEKPETQYPETESVVKLTFWQKIRNLFKFNQ
jgi:X-X-X-Leu-X-X-Gly heptad repeat protein